MGIQAATGLRSTVILAYLVSGIPSPYGLGKDHPFGGYAPGRGVSILRALARAGDRRSDTLLPPPHRRRAMRG